MGIFLENTYGTTPVIKEYRFPTWLFSHMTLICYVLGPLVMIAMWALTVQAFLLIYPASGVYLLFLALLLIFQEFAWLFGKFSFLKQPNAIGTCWRGFVWFDNWKRATEYLLLGIIAFIIGAFSSWPLFVGGSLMFILSAAYFAKAVRFSKIEPLKPAGAPNASFSGTASAPPVQDVEWGSPSTKY